MAGSFVLRSFFVYQKRGRMSFNIDAASLMEGAADMFNALWPAFAIVVGLGLGVKIIQFIRSEITSAI